MSEEEPAAGEPPAQAWLLDKARAVAAKVERLQEELAGAQRIARDSQAREAITRTELTLALHEALTGRAEQAARARVLALAAYTSAAVKRPLRRHNRPSRQVDALLLRLGRWGQRQIIARAGLQTAPFDEDWYVGTNPDVAGGRWLPRAHYAFTGGREQRSPHPLFDGPRYYAENAVEISANGVTALEHYVGVGAAAGRNPHPLFDTARYVAAGARPAPGQDPLSHYLTDGWRQGLSPHPLFDPAWYEAAAGPPSGPPLVHYLAQGWREGLSPHPLFDPKWYLESYPDVAEAGIEPLTHFVMTGAFEGKSPGPWFDLPHYSMQRGEALGPGVNPLIDYLDGGAWAVAEARPGFPSAAYLAAQPELVREGLTPLEHWVRRAGR